MGAPEPVTNSVLRIEGAVPETDGPFNRCVGCCISEDHVLEVLVRILLAPLRPDGGVVGSDLVGRQGGRASAAGWLGDVDPAAPAVLPGHACPLVAAIAITRRRATGAGEGWHRGKG